MRKGESLERRNARGIQREKTKTRQEKGERRKKEKEETHKA